MVAEELAQARNLPANLAVIPDCPVFVVLHKDPLRERIDVRVSRVLLLDEDVLFLAQTEPPVGSHMSGVDVEVALLAEDKNGTMRPFGYVGRLLDVQHDFLEDDMTIQAIAVTAPKPGDFFETSLRMHYRVPVDEEMGVVIRLEGFDEPELLDFSAGGARVSVAATEAAFASLAVEQSIPFRLLFLGSGYAAGDGIVRSLIRSEDGQSATLGIFFTNMEIRDIRYLERMVARTVSVCRQREGDAEYV
ncbi:MAG: PilZ domain-containing protein [Humidesulfovibrio sp.]|uniref:PilZ domain-containing protein n=1 Tax=Humidesulfovibrio sp. TaxID=2910988 RepID=UPI002733EDB9|nr:PilZ domain-containing protein [Humidesulfovibrio sp.]MDP2847484.1 PilZ domain-containing protein [Humidesulfovibrio sp.]